MSDTASAVNLNQRSALHLTSQHKDLVFDQKTAQWIAPPSNYRIS
jgi:hypothetical protein